MYAEILGLQAREQRLTCIAMWYRPIGSPASSDASEEMLLNPRPRRSAQATRQRPAKHTSQSTLKGRGAKRQRTADARHNDVTTSRGDGKRSEHQSSRDHTRRGHRSTTQYQLLEPGSRSVSSRRQHSHPTPSAHPNTSARRDPDRRFAVLAATNTALEHFRREAFAQPSPPPRGERLRRYQGVTIPASSIPFEWSCISSQSSVRYGESSSRHRSRR